MDEKSSDVTAALQQLTVKYRATQQEYESRHAAYLSWERGVETPRPILAEQAREAQARLRSVERDILNTVIRTFDNGNK